MDQTKKNVTMASVTSADGTTIGYRQLGHGPGLIIVHGGMRTSQYYLRLAEALSETFTVSIPDRRGRGLSGAFGVGYSLAKECADLEVLVKKTDAKFVFGHSSGGLITLQAALELPLTKIAVYEPPLSTNGSVPSDWYPAYEKAINENKLSEAFSIVIKGLQMVDKGSKFKPIDQAIVRRRPDLQELLELVPTFEQDTLLVNELESKKDRFRKIEAETLLLGGSKSPGFLRSALRELEETIPRVLRIEFLGLDHNGPDRKAPLRIAEELRRFFL
ncbi:MAG: alpha/beta fold hydrolase [Sporolactobacillus sp.]